MIKLGIFFCTRFVLTYDHMWLQQVTHHHDCVTLGQYVLFQHPIILSLEYDGPI